MEEKIIDFETAKLAKEKGFNEPCNYHYSYGSGDIRPPQCGSIYIGGFVNDNGELRKYINSELSDWKLPYGEFTASTQSLLQKWLREIHKISVCIDFRESNTWKVEGINEVYYDILIYRISGGDAIKLHKISEISYVYEEALEKGIIEALKLIK